MKRDQWKKHMIGGVLLLAVGCSESKEGRADGGSSDGSEDSGNSAPAGPVYVVVNEIYGGGDSTTYVNFVGTLDHPEVDPGRAIEFGGGRATVQAYNGVLFVNPPTSDVIKRFSIGNDGTIVEDGQIGFGNHGFTELYIDDWGNTFVSPTKAYLFNSANGSMVIWDPSTMKITGSVDHGAIDLVREGFALDGSPGVVRGNRFFRTYHWLNWNDYKWSDEAYLAVYDLDSDRLLHLVPQQRCPSLGNRIDRDEAGNLYFSNWIWNVGATLLNGAPESCVLRINAEDEVFDPNWTFSYPEATEGRQGAMFSYLGGGRALMSVFHDERVVIDETTVGSELLSTANWRLWTVDLETRSGSPLEGLEWNSGAISTFHVDERSFLFVPGTDWALTQVYELQGNRAVHNFELQGWSYQFDRVR